MELLLVNQLHVFVLLLVLITSSCVCSVFVFVCATLEAPHTNS